MDVKSIEQLMKQLLKDTDKILKEKVVPRIKEVESSMVALSVYDAYEPTEYIRRRNENGLADTRNMREYRFFSGNTIGYIIKNETEGDDLNTNHLALLVEDGDGAHGYYYAIKPKKGDRAYLKPRPFTQNTVDEIKSSNIHITLMKEGYVTAGYVVV
jgi:hypothetical protein